MRSIKQNYIAALIKEIDPKVVITNIDNSADFYITCKILNKTKIKFIAVQNGNRFDIIHGSKKKIKLFSYLNLYASVNLIKKFTSGKNVI